MSASSPSTNHLPTSPTSPPSDSTLDTESLESFNSMNQDGFITTDILVKLYLNLGSLLNKTEVNEIIKRYDGDKDGKLSYSEYRMLYLSNFNDKDQSVEVEEIFRIFDINNDGYIDLGELKNVFSLLNYNLSENDILNLMKEAKTNKPNMMTLQEFKKVMLQN